jgi:hypothetical protein
MLKDGDFSATGQPSSFGDLANATAERESPPPSPGASHPSITRLASPSKEDVAEQCLDRSLNFMTSPRHSINIGDLASATKPASHHFVDSDTSDSAGKAHAHLPIGYTRDSPAARQKLKNIDKYADKLQSNLRDFLKQVGWLHAQLRGLYPELFADVLH